LPSHSGIKGDYNTTAYELDLKKPIQGDLAELVALATKELKKQNIEPPSGQAKMMQKLLLVCVVLAFAKP
jgi:hypothetical protein